MVTSTVGCGEDLLGLARAALVNDPPTGDMERRLGALRWIETHGFPTAKHEDWRYLPPGSILAQSFRPPSGAPHPMSVGSIDRVAADLGGPRLVFIDGRFSPGASTLSGLPHGLTVEVSGESSLGGDLSGPPVYRHAFEALNDALGEDVTIRIDPDTVLDDPVHLVCLAGLSGSHRLVTNRAKVVAGAQSSARVAATFVDIAGAAALTNSVVTLALGEGAQIDMDLVQDESRDCTHVSLVNVDQDRYSRFTMRSFVLGAKAARHEVRVRLAGAAADARLDGLFVPRGTQRHDHPVLVEHSAPYTRSRQHYQGIADGKAHGVFNGRIVVHPAAHGSDAEQVNRNLLLSDNAEIDTRPRLEIFTDDVRCTHGATVGRLDEAALYYLRSRGISQAQAQSMLIHAVVDQIVERIEVDALRTDLDRRLAGVIDSRGGER